MMSKELEKDFMNDIMSGSVLTVEPKDIAMLLYDIYDVPSGICESIKSLIEKLEAIENANPNEALGCLKRVWNDINNQNNFRQDFKDLTIIENYILKAQEQEKILSIIKDNDVDIVELKLNETLEGYNLQICGGISEQLVQDEFDLLKRWTKNEEEN